MEEYARGLHRLYGSGAWEDACDTTSAEAVVEAALNGFVPTCVEADAYLVQVSEGVVETGAGIVSDTLLSLCDGWEISATAVAGSVRLKRVSVRERVEQVMRTGTLLSHSNLTIEQEWEACCSLNVTGTDGRVRGALFHADTVEDAAAQCVTLHPWIDSLDWKAVA